MPGCLAPKYPGSRFCSLNDHKRSWDNMCYQRRSRRDITDSQRQSFDESMKQEDVAGREVLIFHRDNPPECGKKSLIDFVRFERIRGVRNSLKDSDGDVPMTERQFYKHCENVLGLTEEEMTEFWKELQTTLGSRGTMMDGVALSSCGCQPIRCVCERRRSTWTTVMSRDQVT